MKNDVIDLISALPTGERLVGSAAEFDDACDHVARLLEESFAVFEQGGYSTSIFLAITALEETAKCHIGIFTGGGPDPEKRQKNVFYQHGTKHKMASLPTVAMGTRLRDAVGPERIDAIIELANTGRLIELRESALYFERKNGKITTPRNTTSKTLAREILLFAIEAFDDALVGYTKSSMDISQRTDVIFEKTKSA